MGSFPERVKLDEFFRRFTPTHVLGTTYTLSLAFFESLVLPNIKKDRLERLLILSDTIGLARASEEVAALRSAGRDYMIVAAPCEGSFHPKVWVLLNEDQIVLLVGSGNLTQSGFIENAELFDSLVLDNKTAYGKTIVKDLDRFLLGLIALWDGIPNSVHPTVDTLQEIRANILRIGNSFLDQEHPDVRFLSSFGGPFHEQLEELSERPLSSLFIAAPYFGSSIRGIELIQKQLRPEAVTVFPAVHDGDSVDIPISKVKAMTAVRTASLQLEKKGFAHLKLYGAQSKSGAAWLFCGSVNCTDAALNGTNVEAGIWRKISSDSLKDYFVEAKDRTLPEKLFNSDHGTSSNGGYVFWALDTGEALELIPSVQLREQSPLSNVTIEVSAGAEARTLTEARIFTSTEAERLPWTKFGESLDLTRNAGLVTFSGTSPKGKRIEGRAILDDLWSATARPLERSAFRGAASLLRGEGLPEFADVAAVFTLIQGLFDETGEDAAEPGEVGIGKSLDGQQAPTSRPVIAIWPPVVIDRSLGSNPFGSGLSRLFTAQRILETLLRRPKALNVTGTQGTASFDANDSENAAGEAEKVPIELSDRELNAFKSLWSEAEESFSYLENRLLDCVIQEREAKNLWPTIIFLFLVTLSVRSAVFRQSNGAVELPRSSEWIRRLLAILFRRRNPGEDYCRPDDCRYKATPFPSVAEDLSSHFQVKPHADIAAVVLSAFVYIHAIDRKANRERLFPVNDWLLFREVCPESVFEMRDGVSHLKNIYAAYFQDESEPIDSEMLGSSFDAIRGLDWSAQKGYCDLIGLKALLSNPSHRSGLDLSPHLLPMIDLFLMRFRKTRQFAYSVPGTQPICDREGCRTRFQYDPEKRWLQAEFPVICQGCGALLVPKRLLAEFEKKVPS